MTTVAFDGKNMACDSLATDPWGFKDYTQKIWANAHLAIGCAGNSGQIAKWRNSLTPEVTMQEILTAGYPFYDKENNDPAIMVVSKLSGVIFKHCEGVFIQCSRKFHAIGSGRDFAMGAMQMGANCTEAVNVAIEFDNGSGGTVYTTPVVAPLGGIR